MSVLTYKCFEVHEKVIANCVRRSGSRILTCGFREVVFLCTVICWKNSHSWHSCKDTKMATLLEFCRSIARPVNWYRTKTCDEFVSTWAGHVSVIAADVWSVFVCVGSASVGLMFLRWNFEAEQILYSIFLSSMMFFKRFESSIFRNLTELCTTPAWAVLLVQRSMPYVPSYNVYRNQGKFRHCKLLLELFRLIAINCGQKLNLDLNIMSETDITFAIYKKNKNLLWFTFEPNTNNYNLHGYTIRLLPTELRAKTEFSEHLKNSSIGMVLSSWSMVQPCGRWDLPSGLE